MRLLSPVAATLAAAALLAGSRGTSAPRAAPLPADPGRGAAAALVGAASANDAGAIWKLLSSESRRRAGGSVAAFRATRATSLVRMLGPFAPGYRVVVSQRITDSFGVVAIARGRRAYAFPLRLERGAWRVELPGRTSIEVLGPRPGSVGAVFQVGVEVHGSGVGDAVLYVDGATLDPRIATAPSSATVFANLASRLSRGRHTATVFIALGNNAAARAWTFTAR